MTTEEFKRIRKEVQENDPRIKELQEQIEYMKVIQKVFCGGIKIDPALK